MADDDDVHALLEAAYRTDKMVCFDIAFMLPCFNIFCLFVANLSFWWR